MKFIYKNSNVQGEHWEYCEKTKSPYIEINNVGKNYSSIFYDVTNYHINLGDISDKIKKLHDYYKEFFLLTDLNFYNEDDEYYFFNFLVKQEHAEFIADKLYDYLLEQLLKNNHD